MVRIGSDTTTTWVEGAGEVGSPSARAADGAVEGAEWTVSHPELADALALSEFIEVTPSEPLTLLEQPDVSFRTLLLRNGLNVLLISDPCSNSAAALAFPTREGDEPLSIAVQAALLSSVADSDDRVISGYTDEGIATYLLECEDDLFVDALATLADLFHAPDPLQVDLQQALRVGRPQVQEASDYALHALAAVSASTTTSSLSNFRVKELLENNAANPSAHEVSLVIRSAESLDTLQMMVVDTFGEMRRKFQTSMPTRQYITDRTERSWTLIEGEGAGRTLQLLWPITDEQREEAEWAAQILSNPTCGGLSDRLVRDGLIKEITCEVRRLPDQTYAFATSFEATEKGMQNRSFLISAFHSCRNHYLLRYPQEYIEEVACLDTLLSTCEERDLSSESLADAARKMFFQGVTGALPTERRVDHEKVKKFMASLSASSCHYVATGRAADFRRLLPHDLPNVAGHYETEEIDGRVLRMFGRKRQAWAVPHPSHLLSPEAVKRVQFGQSKADPLSPPTPLVANRLIRAVYKPRSGVTSGAKLRMRSPAIVLGDAHAYACSLVFVQQLNTQLRHCMRQASEAGMETEFSVVGEAVNLEVAGPTAALRTYLPSLIGAMQLPTPKPKLFETLVDERMRRIDEAMRSDSSLLVEDHLRGMLFSKHLPLAEVRDELAKLTYTDYRGFLEVVSRQRFTEMAVAGSLVEEEAQELVSSITSQISAHSYPKRQQQNHKLELERRNRPIVEMPVAVPTYTALLSIPYGCNSPIIEAELRLLVEALQLPFEVRLVTRCNHLFFEARSSGAGPVKRGELRQMQRAIRQAIEDWQNLEEGELTRYLEECKEGLVDAMNTSLNDVRSLVDFHFSTVFERNQVYHWPQVLRSHLSSLTGDQLLSAAERLLVKMDEGVREVTVSP